MYNRSMKNFIYLLKCREFVKVGVSKSDGIASPQRYCPYPVEVIGVFRVNDALAIETRLKSTFANRVSTGGKEWFELTDDEIKTIIKELENRAEASPRRLNQPPPRELETPRSYFLQTVFNEPQKKLLCRLLAIIEGRGGDPNRVSRAEICRDLNRKWCPDFINKNLLMRTQERGIYRLPVGQIRKWCQRTVLNSVAGQRHHLSDLSGGERVDPKTA